MTTRLDRLRSLVNQGWNNSETGREFGVSERQVIRLKHQAGIEMQAQNLVSPEQRAEIRRLSEEEGWPAEEIMATLGVTRTAVDTYCVPGPGQEWRNTAARLALDHRALWNELRGHR